MVENSSQQSEDESQTLRNNTNIFLCDHTCVSYKYLCWRTSQRVLHAPFHGRFGVAVYHSTGLIHAHARGGFGIAFESHHA